MADGMITVALASRNPMKLVAVERAFRRYFNARVVMVPVETGYPRQPVGLGELVGGAAARARAALEAEAGATFGVGIEAGLMEFPSTTGFIEVQVAVVAGRDGRASVGLSQGFELPPGVVERMLEGEELASASGLKRGSRDIGEYIGYIGVATRGAVTRLDLTVHAVLMALTPWLQGGRSWLARLEEIEEAAGALPSRLERR